MAYGDDGTEHADVDDDDVTQTLSEYETSVLKKVLTSVGGELDPRPEGKVVEEVIAVQLGAVQEDDPLPAAFNKLHWTTKRDVVLREVLLPTGSRYRSALERETARNLRLRRQFAFVLVKPLKGSKPNTVRVLVLTRDVWSLRPDFDVAVTPGGIDTLFIRLSETNIGGRYVEGAIDYTTRPETHAFGQALTIPWLLGSKLTLRQGANVIINKESGQAEGALAEIGLQRPLLSSRESWAWGVWGRWQSELVRRYVDARVASFQASTGESYRDVYGFERYVAQGALTHSWNVAARSKLDLSFGAEAAARLPRTVGLEGASQTYVEEYQRARMPVRDRRIGPFARLYYYKTSFAFLEDLNSLGFQEDYRVGPELTVKAYPIARALGSTRDFLGTSVVAQYTATPGASFLRLLGMASQEFSTEQLYDSMFLAWLMAATPPLGIGRLVTNVLVNQRPNNFSNFVYDIGGDTRLRGFPTEYAYGPNLIEATTEFRTRSMHLLSTHFGFVAFYDIGDAYTSLATLRPKQSVGVGIRLVIPALERDTIRFDVGFPIRPSSYEGVSPVGFFLSFTQPFDAPSIYTADTSGSPSLSSATNL